MTAPSSPSRSCRITQSEIDHYFDGWALGEEGNTLTKIEEMRTLTHVGLANHWSARPTTPVSERKEQFPRILFRPLLTQGCLAADKDGGPLYILIDSEQPEHEQAITIWHEALHLLGMEDEAQVEAMAEKLAGACPEIPATLKAIHDPR